ncbi:HAD family hydrolase [Streptomyces lydicus]|uniref:HAD family hydrolase n=1 Tax=Streptomyces lydicus TaxID=47763 RepID=UPI0037B5EB68
MGNNRLAAVLAQSTAVLFDFDGPLCDVFAGLPAPGVALDLAQIAAGHDSALSDKLADTRDPLEVLRLCHAADAALSEPIETALTAAELKAVDVAGDPTDGAVEALRAAHDGGRRIAVVSNNSAECVRAFLVRHALAPYVHEVIGRPAGQPELMKPAPHSVILAASLLGVAPSACTLIGDSTTDVTAAHAAGSTAIGFANKPAKKGAFAEIGADAITDRMHSIAEALALLSGE